MCWFMIQTGANSVFAISGGNVFPDPWFGKRGMTSTDYASKYNWITRMAAQADGKIVAGGNTATTNPTTQFFELARYSADGNLDTTFGSGGLVTAFTGGYESQFSDLAIQSDGKIVAVGINVPVLNDPNFGLVRYNTDGTLDSTFGSGGLIDINIGTNPTYDGANAIALQPDGKLLVAGYSQPQSAGDSDFVIARFLPDGTLDSTFNSNGRRWIDFSAAQDYASELVFDPVTSKIIVAGYTDDATGTHCALARLNMNGTLDTTFGTMGKVIILFGSNEASPTRLRLQADGTLLMYGGIWDNVNPSGAFLARLTTIGSLDLSFGSGGWVTNPQVDLADFDIQADGKIVVAMTIYNGAILLQRCLQDGSPDVSFGNGGYLIFQNTTQVFAYTLYLQPNGKMVVGGDVANQDATDSDFLLMRFSECLFCDDFNDSILDPNWDYDEDVWSENGILNSPSFLKKSQAMATPAFGGCDNCTIGTTMYIDETSSAVNLFAWYADKSHYVEVMLKKNAKWILKYKNGDSSAKAKAVVTSPNFVYDVAVTYDGAQLLLQVDGAIVAALPAVQNVPFGTVGFQVKNGMASWADIVVVPN